MLNEYEWYNSVRLAEYRKLRSAQETAYLIAAYENDKAIGILHWVACDMTLIFTEAKRLSAIHSPAYGYRSFDILQVATALHLGAEEFLTFDIKQKKLAQNEGLKTPL